MLSFCYLAGGWVGDERNVDVVPCTHIREIHYVENTHADATPARVRAHTQTPHLHKCGPLRAKKTLLAIVAAAITCSPPPFPPKSMLCNVSCGADAKKNAPVRQGLDGQSSPTLNVGETGVRCCKMTCLQRSVFLLAMGRDFIMCALLFRELLLLCTCVHYT